MAELTNNNTITVEIAGQDQHDIEVGATAEQLLPLIDVNQNLAAANRQLVEQVLPTLRGGLQTKEVAPADIEQVITPDDGYLGLQRVKVAPYEREVQVVNRRANESEYLYYMEDIATQYQRSDYAVCMAGEFYKNVDTTILAGADAYLTSDGDFYDAQTTHTWHDDDDMHANRWVVYYFKEGDNKSNFMIADNAACPYILAVKGHLGAITSNIRLYIRELIIPDDSSVLDIRTSNITIWNTNKIIIGRILNHTSGWLIYQSSGLTSVTLGIESSSSHIIDTRGGAVTSLYFPKLKYNYNFIFDSCYENVIKTLYLPVLEKAFCIISYENYIAELDLPNLRELIVNQSEKTFIAGTHLRRVNMPVFEGCTTNPNGYSWQYCTLFRNCKELEELYLPKFKDMTLISNYHNAVIATAPKLKRLILPEYIGGASHANVIFTECPNLEYFYAPKSREVLQYNTYNGNAVANMPNLKTFIYGRLIGVEQGFLNCPRLIHLEIATTQDMSSSLPKWEPTEALTDNTDLIEDTDRCATNREQFFVNFVELILHKLQNRTGASKLTLTLSATVYDAIFSDESGFEYEGQPIGDYITSYIAAINWSVAIAS